MTHGAGHSCSLATANTIDELLSVGDLVEICGLKSATELNGRRGWVVSYVQESARYRVRLTCEVETKAVRRANLLPLLASGSSRPPPPRAQRKVDEPIVRASASTGGTTAGGGPHLQQRLRGRDLAEAINLRVQGMTCQEALGARFQDVQEHPDPAKAVRGVRAGMVGLLCGVVASQGQVCPATWFVWSFLALHVVGAVLATDCVGEEALLAVCATFGLHAGVAASECYLWTCGEDGDNSIGQWSPVMLFACVLYLSSFLMECLALPPDFITGVSFFFPMFPAYNLAVLLCCAEFSLERTWLPEHKHWRAGTAAGAALMALGQAMIWSACQAAGQIFWASCRAAPPPPEEQGGPEYYGGLEIPDRRVVKEGPYRGERHPAYLGFVLWASLLYVALEEENELYDEFSGTYVHYSAFTPCHIPMFNSFLGSAAFQREISDHCERGGGVEDQGGDPDREVVGEQEEQEEKEKECPPAAWPPWQPSEEEKEEWVE